MKRFAYIDIEANHYNWQDAEIIEIALLVLDENKKIIDHFHSLIRPQNKLNSDITELTGITDKMLENAPEFNKIAHRLHEKLANTIIVAHKVEFDFELLKKSFLSMNLELNLKKVCTLNLSQKLIPGLSSYSLLALSKLLHIKHKNNHRAQDDVETLSKLHHHLRLLNGEVKLYQDYLSHHKKLIDRSSSQPGLVTYIYNDNKKTIKTDNIRNKLIDDLLICPRNKDHLLMLKQIDIKNYPTLTETFIRSSQINPEKLNFCIYSFYNKNKKLILRVGKTDLKRKAHFYFTDKKRAHKKLRDILSNLPKKKLIYRDAGAERLDIIKENNILNEAIKNEGSLTKNLLIRSMEKHNQNYQYIILKKNRSYAIVHSDSSELKSDDIKLMSLTYNKLKPKEYMSLLQGLSWIKNQKSKTDFISELKANI
jgi:DNA polymerase III epsilon subunit family exonuclease